MNFTHQAPGGVSSNSLTGQVLQFGDFTDSSTRDINASPSYHGQMVNSGFILCIDNPGETGYCAALSRQYFNTVYRFPVNIIGRQHGIGDLFCVAI